MSKKASVLDHMGSAELAANFFRITQTEQRLKTQKITGKREAGETHYIVGKAVRAAMLAIGGTAPEDLPPVENINKLIKETKQDIPLKPNQTETMENEKIEIDISKQLWAIALLIMAKKPGGIIKTRELIEEIPNYIDIPGQYQKINEQKQEPKYVQVIRNLKSNKKNKTNPIFPGYATDIKGGFQITPKGLDFVKEVFKDFL